MDAVSAATSRAVPPPLTISLQQARRLILKKQLLWPPRSLKGRSGVLEFLHRVRMVQFDPVNLIGINPCITINARVQGFVPQMLDDLLYRDRMLFDQWDRCASIVLREDLAPLQRNRGDTNWRPRSRSEAPTEAYNRVLKRFEEESEPLTLSDFKDTDEREALLLLLPLGVIEIHHREGPRRFFSLAPEERRLLFENTTYFSEADDFFAWMICRRIGSTGLLVGQSSIGLHSIRGMAVEDKRKAQQRLLREEKIVELKVEGQKSAYYCLREDLPLLEEDKLTRPRASFLAPLDNLMWDRRLVNDLFAFDYRWEIYTPEEKRQYGPYTLPVLYCENLIARTQLRAKDGILSIEGWWWQPQIRTTKAMIEAIATALKAHAYMLGLVAGETEGIIV